MADVSEWSAKEEENTSLDELTLSGEGGRYTNKVMCAVKKKFDSVDAQLAAAGPYTFKGAVEEYADLADVVTPAVGDAYAISSASGQTYAYDGESWVAIGLVDGDLMHRTGDEVISGEKIFADSRVSDIGAKNNILTLKDEGLTRGTVPSDTHYSGIGIIDSQGSSYPADGGNRLAALAYKAPSLNDLTSRTYLQAFRFVGSGNTMLGVGYDADGVAFAFAPSTSDARSGSGDIVTRGYMEASEWNWQKTKKAGAVAFKPVPESDLEPVVDFIFTETPPAEGEKSPSNPSTITGVSSATVTHCETEGVDSTDYAISFGGTFYGGSLDVATGVMTVTWGAATVTGEENWLLSDSASTETVAVFYSSLGLSSGTMSTDMSESTRACSHFGYSSSSDAGTFTTWGSSQTRLYLRLPKAGFPDVAALKTWLASENSNGNPVFLAYMLATPQTVQLTSTQIKALPALDKYEPRTNTVYSDQEAVQVGYQRFFDENRIAAIEARLDALEGEGEGE